MAYKFKKNLANRSNYGKARALSDIKFIVVHYTSNDGDTDENNGKYFRNNIVKASAHYFVDDDSITQSVPDDYVAYSVGGSRYSNYKTTGGASFYGKATNANTLNIELCDDVRNGSVYPSAGVIANAIDLVKTKMAQYGIPASNVIRHFDVTGKACPAYWSGTAEKNALWISEFKNKLGGTTPQKATTQNAAYYPRYTGNTTSITAALKDIGVDSSYQYRKKIAVANGIVGYAGTAAQNTRLLNLLKAGQLKKA
jgi:N-acetylmuramoyl-L-alanine amidase CwlA